MALLVLYLSGLADDPCDGLGGATPLAAAETPHLDRLAERAEQGLCHVWPEARPTGADRAIEALLGHRPEAARAACELLGLGASLGRHDAGVRLDLLATSPDLDPLPDEPSAEEARSLWDSLAPALSRRGLEVRPAGPTRGLGLWSEGPIDVRSTPPGELAGPLEEQLPDGDGETVLRELIDIGREVLTDHPVNRARAERRLPTFDVAWPWGCGRAIERPIFALRSGLVTVGVTDNAAVRGVFAQHRIPCSPAVWRRPEQLAHEALAAFQQAACVVQQTSIVDWVSHRGDAERKVRAIARLDSELIQPIVAYAEGWSALDLAVLTDATPVEQRRHANRAAPYLRLRRDRPTRGRNEFSEESAAETGIRREGGGWLWSAR